MLFFGIKDNKNPIRRRIRGSIALLFTLVSMTSTSAELIKAFESNEDIRQTAKIFLEETANAADNPAIEVSINKIDSRLRLRKCDSGMQPFLPVGAKHRGKTTVAIRCEAPIAWKIFVSANISEFAEVVVANRNLSKKTIISKQDIQIQRVNVSSLRNQPALSAADVLGSSPKRQIRSGSIIFIDGICMVCRGDNVKVSAQSKFFSIDLEGIALADAHIGEMTSVRNVQSKRTFNAKVVGKDRLEVSLSGDQLK